MDHSPSQECHPDYHTFRPNTVTSSLTLPSSMTNPFSLRSFELFGTKVIVFLLFPNPTYKQKSFELCLIKNL